MEHMAKMKISKSFHKLFALLLAFSFPGMAVAQTTPTPNNPSYTTQDKFTYGRFTQNLEVDGAIQLPAGSAGSVLGGTNYINIDGPATLGQITSLNLTDPGVSSANFLYDQGTTSAVTIQHVAVPLTSANLLAMSATPVQLIAAGAAGTNILVHKVMFTMVRTATAYASGGVVVFQLGNTATGAGTATTATIAASVLTTAGAATTYTTVIPVSYTSTAATGLFISNQTGAFTTGTGTATVDIWYSIK